MKRSTRGGRGPRRPLSAAGGVAELVAGLDAALAGTAPGLACRRARHRQEPARRRAHEPRAPAGRPCSSALLGGRRGAGLLAVDPGAALYIRDAEPERCAAARGGRGGSRPAPPRAARALPRAPGAAGAGGGGRALPPLRGGAFVLVSAADARPLVVVLDDVHAADEPSLLLLQFVARVLDAEPRARSRRLPRRRSDAPGRAPRPHWPS